MLFDAPNAGNHIFRPLNFKFFLGQDLKPHQGKGTLQPLKWSQLSITPVVDAYN